LPGIRTHRPFESLSLRHVNYLLSIIYIIIHTHSGHPIDEWSGLFAMAGFLVTAAHGVSVLSRQMQHHANVVSK
jgi:hypothetical protein